MSTHRRNVSSVSVEKVPRRKLEARKKPRVVKVSRSGSLTKAADSAQSTEHQPENGSFSLAHPQTQLTSQTQPPMHTTVVKIETDNMSQYHNKTNHNSSSDIWASKQSLRSFPSVLSSHSIKLSQVNPISDQWLSLDQSTQQVGNFQSPKRYRQENRRGSPSHSSYSIHRGAEVADQLPVSRVIKQAQDSTEKSTGKTNDQQRLPVLNLKQQKQKKFFPCSCSPLCIFCSLLGAILFGAILTSLLVGFLIPRGTAIRTTRTTATFTTATATSSTTSVTSTTTTAFCFPTCLNGGTCISTNTCLCIPDVWTGAQCQTPIRILWTFDNNFNDLYGNFPGVGLNNPGYRFPGINGYGSCVYLNASANQSITVFSPPFLNMAYTSFSLSAWVNADSLRNGLGVNCLGDNAIFGQNDQLLMDHSLHIIVRSQSIYLGFFSDDTQGNLVLQPHVWYHMAYVYDYATRTQFVYVNGRLDVSRSSAGPYKGTTGDLTIGTNGVCANQNHWDGCIDQVSYFSRAKNASEVLRDATLTVAYPFSNNLLDNGSLGINGTGSNFQYTVSGRAGQGLDLSLTPSYVQAAGLVYLGTDGYPYSISIWIRPTTTTGGTIVHVSSGTASIPWSMPLLGFTNAGNVGVQGCATSGAISLTGPVVTVGVWTHLAVTYDSSNQLRLWVNGTQFGSPSANFSSSTIDTPVTITLGASVALWTLIYNGSTGLDTDAGRYNFGTTQYLSNTAWYLSYRLLIVSKRGLTTATQYAEVQFFGY